MERYNIFHLIHKGLRAALYHTSIQLQQTDFTIEDERENAISLVREVSMLFDDHATKEDGYVLPAIAQHEPSVVSDFESEHDKDEEMSAVLREVCKKMEEATTELEQFIAGKELVKSFQEFTLFNLRHMSSEEDIINTILWRYYSDEEIININHSIVASVAPWIQDFYATWIFKGINNTEACAWISNIERTMPAAAYRTMLKKAEQVLGKRRFQKISRELEVEKTFKV